jgi:hypothetical protein
MKKILFLLLSATSLLFLNCTSEEIDSSDTTTEKFLKANNENNKCGGPKTIVVPEDAVACFRTDFLHQNEIVGYVQTFQTQTDCYYVFNVNSNWKIKRSNLFVGNFNNIPLNSNGGPVVSNFPFKTFSDGGVSKVVVKIAKNTLSNCVTLSANMRIKQNNSCNAINLWAQGNQFTPTNNCATIAGSYSDICFNTCESIETKQLIKK